MKKALYSGRGQMVLLQAACGLAFLGGITLSPAVAAVRRVPEGYPTIQAAIYAAAEGDTVLIAPGTYRGNGNRNIELAGKDLIVTSEAGPEQTIIDCEGAGRGFRIHQGESLAARIEKLTIVNGNAFGGEGGGITCDVASATIADCRIQGCQARFGGGVGLILSGGRIERCIVSGNSASDGGGGIVTFYTGHHTISDCVITGNSALRVGGVAFADDPGGNVLRRCTVAGNTSEQGAGGGVYTNESALLDRCILWGNCAPQGSQLYAAEGSTSLICSDVDSAGVDSWIASISYDGQCIFTDPLFCAPATCSQTTGGDWMLSDNSPCLPWNSPCGILIGALDAGCGVAYPPGACCLPGGTCVVVSAYICSMQQGSYLGNGTLCQPDPCQPTPVERTSWGRIKAAYR